MLLDSFNAHTLSNSVSPSSNYALMARSPYSSSVAVPPFGAASPPSLPSSNGERGDRSPFREKQIGQFFVMQL